jgi:acyl-CoA reductase-like NAD-dependent aldehyde dehydrogenase
LTKVSLELGGKSAAIALPDADPAKVVSEVRLSGMGMAGQICNALTRVLVPADQADEYADAMASELAALKVGDPTDPETVIGPLVAKRQQERVRAYIEAGVADGARLVLGGSEMPAGLDRGWYVRPTVFADADNSMKIAREEIFGPVITIVAYSDEAEAVRLANDSEYGLAGSVFTRDLDHGLEVAAAVRSGTFGVNQSYAMDPAGSFGGVKGSGYGRELGREGLEGYLDTKTVTVAAPE